MSNRTLGILGMIGAPFLLISTIHDGFKTDVHSGYAGLFGFIYITAWMCSLIALRRMGALGEYGFGKIIFILQMIFLFLVNIWNLYEWIQPGAGTGLYCLLDIFWPVSNLCMFVTGITIAIKGHLKGWKRFVPLVVGCWLPAGLIAWAIFSRTPGMLLFINIYSVLAWSLMGCSIILQAREIGDDNNQQVETSWAEYLYASGK
jgi:hypothetical protein